MYEGRWEIYHPGYGDVSVMPVAQSSDESSTGSWISGVIKDNSQLFEVNVKGGQPQTFALDRLNITTISLDYVKGKEKENDRKLRPAIELQESKENGITPIFRGYLSFAYLNSVDDHTVTEELETPNYKKAVRNAFIALLVALIAMIIFPIIASWLFPAIDGAVRWVADKVPFLEEIPAARQQGRQTLSDKIQEIFPFLDPERNSVLGWAMDHQALVVPPLAALIVAAGSIVRPYYSRMWKAIWKKGIPTSDL
ncbi:hypothetical protein [Corynebacterium cystitidis]|uniref:hypothetical protein n=1 Tax=Corynebacterium cystitidis TaxID=35757 RepID=UPI00211E1103|nr:hypothetical protein [Corynebacterium cystitidis]